MKIRNIEKPYIFNIIVFIIYVICNMAWLLLLRKTDSYFFVYIIFSAISLISLVFLIKTKNLLYFRSFEIYISSGAGLLISLFIVVANYKIFSYYLHPGILMGSLKFAFSLIYVLIFGTLLFLLIILGLFTISNKINAKRNNNWKTLKILYMCIFVLLSLYYVAIDILGFYPGMITADSIDQISQTLSGQYVNHHPIFSTLLIKLWLSFAKLFSTDLQFGIFCYIVFQIILFSSVIAYAVITVYEFTSSRVIVAILLGILLFSPVILKYTLVMWKDVIFAIFVLLFFVSFFRFIFNIGRSKFLNGLLMVFGGLGFCVLRSNGIIAFAVTSILLIIMFWKKNNMRKIFIGLLCISCLSWVSIYGVLKAYNVQPNHTVEALGIPIQQVSRVVYETDTLDQNDSDLINKLVPIEVIKEKYNPNIVDPIKFHIIFNTSEQLDNHLADYFTLYFRLAIKYPSIYFKAWIDQIRGYINGGYNYWVYPQNSNNHLNDIQLTTVHGHNEIVLFYENTLENIVSFVHIFKVFTCTGIWLWLYIILAAVSILNKRKKSFSLLLFSLIIIGTLLISAPVFAEYRYIYSIAISLPFLFIFVMYDKKAL